MIRGESGTSMAKETPSGKSKTAALAKYAQAVTVKSVIKERKARFLLQDWGPEQAARQHISADSDEQMIENV